MSLFSKPYKETRISLGGSDIASLILVGCKEGVNGLYLNELHFAGDNNYYAYIVRDPLVEIPNHYHLEYTYNYWMKVYDDDEKIYRISADIIEVYRSGDYGCIIRALDKDE